MAIVVALALSLVFGGADQYLGSLSMHPWGADISLLSAPWLLVAFLAGWTQREPRRAALLGYACTLSAFVGYGLMTLSPMENADLNMQSAAAFVRSEMLWLAGAVFTGPLFGWFGSRWRTEHAWLDALATAAAVSLEPLVRIPAGRAIRYRSVWIAEVAVGLVMLAYVITQSVAARRDTGRALGG